VAKPVLRRVPGWTEDITGITKFGDLPASAQQYCRAIEEIIGKPIEFVSVGPDRCQTIRIS
jgi:adenylosuccinate synthase